MDSITVKVSDLYEMVDQIKKDGMETVTLTIIEPDDEFPACVNFSARKESNSNDWESVADWDYDNIDAV